MKRAKAAEYAVTILNGQKLRETCHCGLRIVESPTMPDNCRLLVTPGGVMFIRNGCEPLVVQVPTKGRSQ